MTKPLVHSTTTDNIDLILLDNPGYDEYDCETGAITKVVKQIQLISSAYVFVITFDTYTKVAVAKQLKNLYFQNKGRRSNYIKL